jgi:hypothetical protein
MGEYKGTPGELVYEYACNFTRPDPATSRRGEVRRLLRGAYHRPEDEGDGQGRRLPSHTR